MTAPWLAPDGRPWFAHRRRRPVFGLVPGFRDGDDLLVHARRTRVSVAARHLCTSVRASPLGKAALWRFGWAPWLF